MEFYKFKQVDEKNGVPEVDPVEVYENMDKLSIVDVRTAEEFTGELGHIGGAQLIPVDSLPEQIDQVSNLQTVVFVCRSGARSALATDFAKQNGYQNVYNLKGGMILWNNLGLKTE